jgi:uroporphyrinogen decarboxylase
MFAFAVRLADDPDSLKREAQQMVDAAIRRAERLCNRHGGLDGFALCADYCFNTGPFLRPRASPSS